ncbi:MAG TPA: hypothetical protein VEI83_14745 [Acidimicrobiales bacterium]|nr:hypothetical protein [Acidimicrobiales bacterium]
MRRTLWLGTGAALGAGGTLWARRRIERLATRLRPGSLAGEVSAGVGRSRRALTDRVHHAVESGRIQARRREDELWRDLRVSEGRAR